jgi:hypothetical protein
MGGEKFIRQLPLVIAIILMISNCQSANDSYDGGDGSTDGISSSGGNGYGSSSIGGSSDGMSGGYMGPNAGMSSGASDPSDGVVVQLPQQISGQWQMVATKLSTVTKYDIYTRMNSYYGDVSKSTNLQSQMINNRAAMGTSMMTPMGGGMMNGGMPSMMTPSVQSAQMAQAAQMNSVQLQQRVQMLMQQLYMLQMQNQQLQMHIQSGRSGRVDDDDDDDQGSDRMMISKGDQKAERQLKEIATLLGVDEDSDLANALEERLRQEPEEKATEGTDEWEKKYNDLVDRIPTKSGETPEEALERLIQSSREGQENPEEENEASEEETPSAQDSEIDREEDPRADDHLEDANSEDMDDANDGTEIAEEKTELREMKRSVFNPKNAPKSLTTTQKRQLSLWREKRTELEKLAKCPSKKHSFSEPQEWAFLKKAFESLKKFAKCAAK